jgi:hypothetical protein
LSLHLPEVGNWGDEGRFPADVPPKALCKGTARDQMICCLRGTVAQFTDIGVHNVLHLQVAFALDAPLEKKPSEELHFRRSMVLPHKLVEGTGAIQRGRQLVYFTRDQEVVSRLQRAVALVDAGRRCPGIQDELNRCQFGAGLAAELRGKEGLQAGRSDIVECGPMVEDMTVQHWKGGA